MEFILITQSVTSANEIALIKSFFDAGLQTLHVRKPELDKNALLEFLQEFNTEHLRKIVIHQHYDLAPTMILKGLHFTERVSAAERKRLSAMARQTGLSLSSACHSVDQLKDLTVDYTLLSPIFGSISKKGLEPLKRSEDFTDQLKAASSEVYAMGGVELEHVKIADELGFSGVACLGSVWESKEPLNSLNSLLGECATCGPTS